MRREHDVERDELVRVGAVEGGGQVEGRVGEVAARVLRWELAGRGRDTDDRERLADGVACSESTITLPVVVAGSFGEGRSCTCRRRGGGVVGEHEVHDGLVGPVRGSTCGRGGSSAGSGPWSRRRARSGAANALAESSMIDEVLEGRELGDLGEAAGRGRGRRSGSRGWACCRRGRRRCGVPRRGGRTRCRCGARRRRRRWTRRRRWRRSARA